MVRWRYLTLPGGVLAIWPHQNLKYHFSGTDSWIKLRPICKYMIWSKYSTKSKGSYPILAPTKILLEKMTLPWQPMTPTFCYKIFFFYKSMGGKTDFNIFRSESSSTNSTRLSLSLSSKSFRHIVDWYKCSDNVWYSLIMLDIDQDCQIVSNKVTCVQYSQILKKKLFPFLSSLHGFGTIYFPYSFHIYNNN